MSTLRVRLKGYVAGGLILVLVVPLSAQSATPSQQPGSTQQGQGVSYSQSQSQDSDIPAVKTVPVTKQSDGIPSGNPSPPPLERADANADLGASQSGPPSQENDATKPVGAAAAPYVKASGVTASRPAGAVIAAGKQRRARTILIRLGVVVGAAVAIGTVVALSRSTSSRPN
jgi:hypothetical protein